MTEHTTSFRALDGTTLSGTVRTPDGEINGAVVFAHGGGVTREEGGFFTRLAEGIADHGFISLRFDLRAHGTSEGIEHELTIASVANDIRAASDHIKAVSGLSGPVHVIAASFSGGPAAMHAASRPRDVGRLVLLNPRLEFRERFVDERSYWHDGYLSEEMADRLTEQGFTERAPFGFGRALLNEVFQLDPVATVAGVRAPTLIVHGTKDTFVPVESSRRYAPLFGCNVELHELEGAQHGFAVHDDPKYLNPQTRAWQAEVIAKVARFLAR